MRDYSDIDTVVLVSILIKTKGNVMENTMRIMIIIDGFFALQLYRKGISQGKKIIFPELVR